MAEQKKNRIKTTWIVLSALAGMLLVSVFWFHLATTIKPPDPGSYADTSLQAINPEAGFFYLKNNWIQKNKEGLWEMYIEGKPFERGVINGKLTKSLIALQEKAFIDRIREMVPSDGYLRFLKYFIYWFNRDLDTYVPEEYKLEIYGISVSASAKYDFIGSGYQRMLNYHSAHDIGHALQELSLVGCTSFGIWGDKSKDSELIVGRNFDFYAGDAFSENKIICFEKPENGFGFMMVTWAGMIGTVSGMNEAGLTVTINAAKSDMPWSARAPVSIVAREILQYASTLQEAYVIAKKRETFVSESILVGSAKENKAGIIEKSPYKIALVIPTSNFIASTNHFQSEAFVNDPLNVRNKAENASCYRYQRLIQDISTLAPMDYRDVASILRDKKGLDGADPGYGNEKAINQLIAHHSIIFKPLQLQVWVSTPPWQLGKYICYDLNDIFHKFAGLKQREDISDTAQTIPADSFLQSTDYQQFLRFKEMREELKKRLHNREKIPLSSSFLTEFINSNPGYFEVYSLIGDYYFQKGQWKEAKTAFHKALTRIIPGWEEKLAIIEKMAECNLNIKKTQQ